MIFVVKVSWIFAFKQANFFVGMLIEAFCTTMLYLFGSNFIIRI